MEKQRRRKDARWDKVVDQNTLVDLLGFVLDGKSVDPHLDGHRGHRHSPIGWPIDRLSIEKSQLGKGEKGNVLSR